MLITILVLLFLFIPAVTAAETVEMKPETPVFGSTVTVTYNPDSPTAVFRDVDAVDLYTLHWYDEGEPHFHLFSMSFSDGLWRVSIPLDDESLRLIQFKFKAGEHSDDNNGEFWDIQIYDDDGNVPEGGYFAIGRSWSFYDAREKGYRDIEMIRDHDFGLAISYFEKELERNPEHYPSVYYYIMSFTQMRVHEETDPATVQEEIEQLMESYLQDTDDDPHGLAAKIIGHRVAMNVQESQQYTNRLIDIHPTHYIAEMFRFMSASEQSIEANERIQRAKSFVEEFPHSQFATPVSYNQIYPRLLQAGEERKILDWLDTIDPPNPQLYDFLVIMMLGDMKGLADVEYPPEEIIPVAEKAIETVKEHPVPAFPPYLTGGDRKRFTRSFELRSALFYMNYARVLNRAEKYDKAIEAIAEAFEISEGKSAHINRNYVRILHNAGKHDDAVEMARKAIVLNQADDELLEYMKNSYLVLYDSEEGFDDLVAMARGESVARERVKLVEEMVKEPAKDFTLEKLDGTQVSLSDKEGKVVVLEFWSTWCGPCISAFPYFQRVVDHFEDNPDVIFLAVNTWQSEEGDERIEVIRNFLEENDYTFTVILDDNRVVREYDVDGIPTRFTIDREGNIRFIDRGFKGPGMEQDMKLQIELLLDGYEPVSET